MNYHPIQIVKYVYMGDNSQQRIFGMGDLQLKATSRVYYLRGVLHVPGLHHNLLSVSRLTDVGIHLYFEEQLCFLLKDGLVLGTAMRRNNLYEYRITDGLIYALTTTHSNGSLWHGRFCHASFSTLLHMKRYNIVDGLSLDSQAILAPCEACALGKPCRRSFNHDGPRAHSILELTHMDICGPLPQSFGGSIYFLLIVDDYSRYCFIFPLKKKSDVFPTFCKWKAMVELQKETPIKRIRSDNGGEFKNHIFNSFCSNAGIIREFTVPHTPQHNGVVERKNRTVLNAIRTMLIHSGLGTQFWAEAANTSIYVQNRTSSSSIDNLTPFEIWNGKKPVVSHFKVFGCQAYAYISKETREKLQPSGVKVIFLGYSDNTPAYRLFNILSNQIILCRYKDTIVNENIMFNTSSPSSTHNILSTFQEYYNKNHTYLDSLSSNKASHPLTLDSFDVSDLPDNVGGEYEDLSDQLHENIISTNEDNSTQSPQPMSQQEFHTTRVTRRRPPVTMRDYYTFISITEPISIKDALNSDEREYWQQAMDAEYNSLIHKGTWELVSLPPGRKPIKSKWIYRVKTKADGTFDRFKARLVAQGFSQIAGVDYQETFSPVVRLATIRALLVFVVNNNLIIHQMDVKTAFLNGDLAEDIYMEQPEGYKISGQTHLVCKLRKSLYGLKQASRSWYQKINAVLISQNYFPTTADGNLYYKKVGGDFIFIALYVDDTLLVSNNLVFLSQCKMKLQNAFDMVDLGSIKSCLGLQIQYDEGIIRLSQQNYILDLLDKYNMTNAKTQPTPLGVHVKLIKSTNPQEDHLDINQSTYASLVGSLMYLAHATRPDISYVVNTLGQFMSTPGRQHWSAATRVLRYLKGTSHYALVYTCQAKDHVSPRLVGYTDADWGGCPNTLRSTSGACFFIDNSLISWYSKKQHCIAVSTTEAEYVAASMASRELVWLRRLQHSFQQTLTTPAILRCDNKSAISLTKDEVFHSKSKHIEIHYHYIKQEVKKHTLSLEYCCTDNMIADIFTKALPITKHEDFRTQLHLIPSPT